MKLNNNFNKNFFGIAIVLIAAMMAIVPFAAAAQESSSVSFMDNLRFGLTFDKEKKAERGLDIASKRLLQVQEALAANNTKKADQAQEQYDKMMQKVDDALQKLNTDGSVENAKTALEKIARIQNRIESHAQKVADVKEAILAKAT